jgi:hypothetical protein
MITNTSAARPLDRITRITAGLRAAAPAPEIAEPY